MHGESGLRLRSILRLVFLVAAVVLLVACGDDDATIDASAEEQSEDDAIIGDSDDSDDSVGDGDGNDASTVDEGEPVAIDLNRLTTGTWILRFGGGPDGDIELVDGYPVTITFDGDGGFGGIAACNGYGGTWAIDGAQLTLSGIGMNAAGCEAAAHEAESRYLAALLDVGDINLVGDELALGGTATELIFAPQAAAPVSDLVGPTWLLEATIADGASTPVGGDPATLTVRADGTFDGSTGCRTLTGRYTVSGSAVWFNELAADGDCPASLADQDGRVINVLGDGFTAEIDGDQMLLASIGNEGLQYRAVSEDELTAIAPTDVVTDAEALEGIPWIFVGGDGPDGLIVDPRTIDPAAVITLTFEAGGYSGRVVCNTYGGSADIETSLWSFSLGPAAATEAGCGQPFDDPTGPVAVYLAAISQMNEGGFDDELTSLVMNGNDIELMFERAD